MKPPTKKPEPTFMDAQRDASRAKRRDVFAAALLGHLGGIVFANNESRAESLGRIADTADEMIDELDALDRAKGAGK